MDFTKKPGKFLPARRTYMVSDQNDLTMLTDGVAAFTLFEFIGVSDAPTWYAMGTDQGGTFGLAYQSTTGRDPTDAFDKETNPNDTHVTDDDMIAFTIDGTRYLLLSRIDQGDSTKKNISSLDTAGNFDGDYFTNVLGGSKLDRSVNSLAVPTTLAVAQIGQPLLLIGHKNELIRVDSSKNVDQPAVSLDESQWINRILTTSTSSYLLCRNADSGSGEAFIYKWQNGTIYDEANNTTIEVTERAYPTNSSNIVSGTVLDDVPYVLTHDGRLLGLSGSRFKQVAAFPTYYKNLTFKNANNQEADRFVHPRGMDAVNGRIQILLKAELEDGSYDADTPSGVWEYDPEVGLYHKYSLTLDKNASSDYGQPQIAFAGALKATGHYKSQVLLGGKVYTDDKNNTLGAIWAVDDEGNFDHRSVYITPEVHATKITAKWQRVVSKFRQFAASSDSIVGKYRTDRQSSFSFVASITWSDDSTFTSTDSNFGDAGEGDEVFVYMGNGGGTTAHISSKSLSGSTYTINLDESIQGVSSNDTGKVEVDNWRKIGSATRDDVSFHEFPIGATDTFVQCKFELRGEQNSPEIHQFLIINEQGEQLT